MQKSIRLDYFVWSMFIAHCSHTPHPQLVLFNCPPLLYFRGHTLQHVLSNSPKNPSCDFYPNVIFDNPYP